MVWDWLTGKLLKINSQALMQAGSNATLDNSIDEMARVDGRINAAQGEPSGIDLGGEAYVTPIDFFIFDPDERSELQVFLPDDFIVFDPNEQGNSHVFTPDDFIVFDPNELSDSHVFMPDDFIVFDPNEFSESHIFTPDDYASLSPDAFNPYDALATPDYYEKYNKIKNSVVFADAADFL